MNERIKELAHEAGLPTYNPDGIPTKLEKFAELIVKECADIATMNQFQWDSSGEYILKHFGIKE